MTRDATRQPDQDPALWDPHVVGYEAVFEPLTNAFAPGLDALMAGLGADRPAVEAEFARALEADQGLGRVSLGAVAHVAVARRTA